MTAYRPATLRHLRLHADTGERRTLCAVIDCKKNNANEGCNKCASAGLLQLFVVAAILFSFIASLIACFILLVIGA